VEQTPEHRAGGTKSGPGRSSHAASGGCAQGPLRVKRVIVDCRAAGCSLIRSALECRHAQGSFRLSAAAGRKRGNSAYSCSSFERAVSAAGHLRLKVCDALSTIIEAVQGPFVLQCMVSGRVAGHDPSQHTLPSDNGPHWLCKTDLGLCAMTWPSWSVSRRQNTV